MFGRKHVTETEQSTPGPDPTSPHATEADIMACFRLLLGRQPSPDERRAHLARAGADLRDIVKSFLVSEEFARRELLADQYQNTVEVVTEDGFDILVWPEEPTICASIKAKTYEPHTVAAFRRMLRPGMSVVDIGANVGFLTLTAAALVGPTGSVVAVEPNPMNVKLMEASRRLNGFAHVRVLPVAAGREVGLLALRTDGSNGTAVQLTGDYASPLGATMVPVVNLEAALGDHGNDRVDFIKVDVEGAEGAALAGLERIIDRDHPAIVSEFSPDAMPMLSGMTGREYLESFVRRGYKLSVLRKDGQVTDCGSDIEGVMLAFAEIGEDHIDILAQ